MRAKKLYSQDMKNKIKYIFAIIGILIPIAGQISEYVILLNPVLFPFYYILELSNLIILSIISGFIYLFVGWLFEKKGLLFGFFLTIVLFIISLVGLVIAWEFNLFI